MVSSPPGGAEAVATCTPTGAPRGEATVDDARVEASEGVASLAKASQPDSISHTAFGDGSGSFSGKETRSASAIRSNSHACCEFARTRACCSSLILVARRRM